MPKKTNSYVTKSGQAYYKFTGRYNEVTKDAIGQVNNDASDAKKQRNLGPNKSKKASATTLKRVSDELGW